MSAEVWTPHPYLTDYAVSSEGRVMRVATGKGTRPGKVLKPGTSSSGYPVVNIAGRMRKVHLMMLEAFVRLGAPGEEGRHADDVKTNNVLSNLSWGTKAQNYADRVSNGGGNHGSRHGCAILNEAQVQRMREAYPARSCKELAAEFKVAHYTVWQIVTKRSWKHI